MKNFLSFIFILFLFVAGSDCSVYFNNCHESNSNIELTDFVLLPNTDPQIGTTYHFTTEIEIHNNEVVDAQIRILIFYRDLNDDPLLNTTADFCSSEFFDCPLKKGKHIYKSKNLTIPYIYTGKYRIEMKFYEDNVQTGCMEWIATISDKPNPPKRPCLYESYIKFSEIAHGYAQFDYPLVSERNVGGYLQVGDLGQFFKSKRGVFSNFDGSDDNTFGKEAKFSEFNWCINTTSSDVITYNLTKEFTYVGDFWIGSKANKLSTWDDFYMRGNIYLTGNWSLKTNQMLNMSGEINVSPGLSIPTNWDVPISYGKLNPIPFKYSYEEDVVLLQKSKYICQCEIDICGVCGGDNSTCPSPTPKPTKKSSDDKKFNYILLVEILVPIMALIIIVLIILIIKRRYSHNKYSEL
ncbi:phosphatidylglycerol/phosphatidylinositol transfer protein [Anaeramoeba flamelloides]|uniref:Phosphatidylglycerol/phosphatidylinositol transfer protein n=1 Tax=Anaeramoeba flamelloides TaxID=1746091 RepID=A0AAV7ZBM7_9EUKA|nr:phosphatidylglycerol/phosphatidylinositol transfer protein [Anaeramoeba flamelloides]